MKKNREAMNSFMIDIDLPHTIGEDFIRLIPYQKSFVDKLMIDGIILNYSVSSDRKKLWVVMQAESIHDIRKYIGSFPIFMHIRFRIHNLLINETNTIAVPQMCLN